MASADITIKFDPDTHALLEKVSMQMDRLIELLERGALGDSSEQQLIERVRKGLVEQMRHEGRDYGI